jgi:dephospho-CoA kinase
MITFNIPNRITEANIQAEIYRRLYIENIPCYLEYKHEHSKFDIVILNQSKTTIIAIIEIKSKIKNINIISCKKQFDKYSRYGLPLIYCNNCSQINNTIESIKDIYNNHIE